MGWVFCFLDNYVYVNTPAFGGQKLGLAVGISSGDNFLGAVKVQNMLGDNSVVVTTFSDSNKKYLSTDLVKNEPIRADYLCNELNFWVTMWWSDHVLVVIHWWKHKPVYSFDFLKSEMLRRRYWVHEYRNTGAGWFLLSSFILFQILIFCIYILKEPQISLAKTAEFIVMKFEINGWYHFGVFDSNRKTLLIGTFPIHAWELIYLVDELFNQIQRSGKFGIAQLAQCIPMQSGGSLVRTKARFIGTGSAPTKKKGYKRLVTLFFIFTTKNTTLKGSRGLCPKVVLTTNDL